VWVGCGGERGGGESRGILSLDFCKGGGWNLLVWMLSTPHRASPYSDSLSLSHTPHTRQSLAHTYTAHTPPMVDTHMASVAQSHSHTVPSHRPTGPLRSLFKDVGECGQD